MNSVEAELKLWLCRTCLLEKSEQDMKEIEDIGNLLRDIIPIRLEEKKTGWPSKICTDCIIQANHAYQFRAMCIQSHQILTERMSQKQEEDNVLNNIHTNNSEFSSNFQSPMHEEEKEKCEVLYIKEETYELCVKEEEEEITTIDDYTIIEESEENQTELEMLDCCFCQMKFNDKNELTNHKRKHLNERICHYCEKRLATVKAYRRHIGNHKERGSNQCKTCGKSFSSISTLRRHERIHARDIPYKCTLCNKSFGHSGNFKRHLFAHTEEKHHMCHICGKKYSTEYLREHIKLQHIIEPDQRAHICECGKRFKSRKSLARHKIVHTTERKCYLCNVCKKSFKHMRTLRQHEKIHKEDKLDQQRPYVCECGESFKYRRNLIRHKSVHTNERKYECGLCKKTFKRIDHLQQHERVHKGVKQTHSTFK